MEKSMFSQTKGTQLSFPLILGSLKQREDESEQSLFKNDSLSSDQPAKIQQKYQPPQINKQNNTHQIDQIRKFLKKGDTINNNTLKMLKQDQQIKQMAKNDRSTSSLYKINRHFQNKNQRDDRQKQIKKIYKNNSKQRTKIIFRPSKVNKKDKMSQQVQTEKYTDFNDNLIHENNYQYTRLHKPSYMTLEMISENVLPKNNQNIQQDCEQDITLPRKGKRMIGIHRNKALSMLSNNTDYIQSINKQQFNFRTTMQTIGRYKQYQPQQTVFNKTIQVKPITTIDKQFSNIVINQQQKKQKAIFNNKQKSQINNKNSRKTNQIQSSQISTLHQSIGIPLQLQLPLKVIGQQSRDRNSSIIPDRSQRQTILSHKKDSPSRLTIQSKYQTKRAESPEKTKRQKLQQKQIKNQLIQVPSVHQIRVGEIKNQKNVIMHPIRQNFSSSELDWFKQKYNPKSQLLKSIFSMDYKIKKYKNGVYFGQLNENGAKQGKGVIFYFNGKIYEGQFKQDYKQGKGLQCYPDGSNYKGQFRKGLKQGRGIFQWSNGQVYDGQWQAGKKNGSGMWQGADKQSYIGQWKNDKVQGFGVFLMNNCSRYEGQFKNSLKHGVGTQRFYNGETYVGAYQKNRPNGEGQYYWANGDYYKGQFSNGMRHGQGYFKEHKTGIEYKGQYKNDKKCGYGQIHYSQETVYFGNLQNNYRHGYGELRQNGKIKYQGYWINDKQADEDYQMQITGKKKNKNKNKTIVELPEKQISFPKAITRKNQHKSSLPKNKSISPASNDEGYRRPCGCNRKH